MGSFIETLRTGSWLTPERIRLWAIAALIAAGGGLLFVLATAHGLNDYQGRPIGTDFSNVYAAGSYVLEGRAEAPFDAPTQHAREKEFFGTATPFYGWHYPPFFLFVAVLLALLLFDLWALPAATAWLVVGYFAAALAVDTMFTGAAFCKHVCPVGRFNFIASTLSPLEVGVRDPGVCRSCTTVDCIKGREVQSAPVKFVQRGCELALFLPSKVGNLDCTFCLDCVQACPHDNVGLHLRVPGEELADDRRRSSLGRLSRRPDLAAFAIVFTFGALLNAFAMAAPVYSVEAWLAGALHTRSEAVVLTLLFLLALLILPLSLTSLAAWITRRAVPASTLSVRDIAVRFAFAFVPFGVGVWLAHYGFHFLTGVGTVLPVAQNAVIDATGRALIGEPMWQWLGLRPGAVFPVQLGSVLLGALGSVMLVHRISERDHSPASARAAAPWGVLIIALTVVALWILVQPMEMRGVNLGG